MVIAKGDEFLNTRFKKIQLQQKTHIHTKVETIVPQSFLYISILKSRDFQNIFIWWLKHIWDILFVYVSCKLTNKQKYIILRN